MEQKDKDLLLKDLCARLPYGVHIRTNNKKILKLWGICHDDINGYWVNSVYELDEVKPYLRPMSNMTEEEKQVYDHRLECMFYDTMYDDAFTIDWLNEHHFDYRGLIDRGLAIEVTEDNNPYKD